MEPYSFHCTPCGFSHPGECAPKAPAAPSQASPPSSWDYYLPTSKLPRDLAFPAWKTGDIVACSATFTNMVVKVIGQAAHPSNGISSGYFNVRVLASDNNRYRKVGEVFRLGRQSVYGEQSKIVGWEQS